MSEKESSVAGAAISAFIGCTIGAFVGCALFTFLVQPRIDAGLEEEQGRPRITIQLERVEDGEVFPLIPRKESQGDALFQQEA